MTPTELNSQLNLQHKAHLLTSLPGRSFPLPSSLKLPLYLTVCLLSSSRNHAALSSSFHVFTLLQIYFMDPFLQLKSVGTTDCSPCIWPSASTLKWMNGWKVDWAGWVHCDAMAGPPTNWNQASSFPRWAWEKYKVTAEQMRPGFVPAACTLLAFSPINEPDVISPPCGVLNSSSIPSL